MCHLHDSILLEGSRSIFGALSCILVLIICNQKDRTGGDVLLNKK